MQMMMKMGMTSGEDAEVVEFDLKLIKRRLTVQEDETERVGDGGDGGECARARARVCMGGAVTSPRGVLQIAGEENQGNAAETRPKR